MISKRKYCFNRFIIVHIRSFEPFGLWYQYLGKIHRCHQKLWERSVSQGENIIVFVTPLTLSSFCKLQLFCNSVALDSHSEPFCAPTGSSYYSISILCIEYWLDYWAGRRKWREKEREVFFLTTVCFIYIRVFSWISSLFVSSGG